MMDRKQKYGFGSFGDMKLSLLDGAVISSFFPEGKEITIKKIIKRVDYSYERVNSSLKHLVEKKLVNEKKFGKTLVFSLNLDSIYCNIGFDSYMLQREVEFIKTHRTIYNALKEIINNPQIKMVLLFGSYSKGIETKNSDVDIMCSSNNKKESEYFIKSLKNRYNVDFAPVVLSIEDFSNIKKDNPELWDDLKMHGIAFKGGEEFYYWMYEDGKQD